MINLLPEDQKKELVAARANVLLLRYNLLIVGAFVFIIAAVGVAYVYLATEKSNVQSRTDQNLVTEQKYTKVKQEADAFQKNLADAKVILDSNLRYSKAITEIAKLLPTGTAIDSVSLSDVSFSGPQNLTVSVNGESAAAALMRRLDSSPLVESAERGKINTTDDDTSPYNYTMEVKVTFNKEIAQ